MLLERTADDVNPAGGCRRCAAGRDALSGWGRLNVARALTGAATPPAPDRFEPNDDAGAAAARLFGARTNITATVDFWDDQIDVYSLRLGAGQRLTATLRGPARANTNLVLWRPGTPTVESVAPRNLRFRAAQSSRPGARERLVYRAPRSGWYYLEVKIATPGFGPYALTFAKR
jgi:hypothetical protein